MSYKSILVAIDGSAENDRCVEVAARLAGEHHGHLTGLAIVPPLELPQRLRSHPGAKAILTEEFEKALVAANTLVAAFPARARAAGAHSADAKVAESEAFEGLAAAARTADLVVLGQPARDDLGALGAHFVETAVLELGRPVLLVPRKGAVQRVGERILVAWKNASASARALADARPLLAAAQSIVVLTVGEDGSPASAQEPLAYLKRHGVKAQPTSVSVAADDVGEAILAQAKKMNADLVVMGAFARPRMAEMILGGATNRVLRDMRTCVLMSH